MKSLAPLKPYFARYRWRLVSGIVAIFFAAMVGLAAPLVIGRAVDALKVDLSTTTLLRYAGLLVLVALVQGVFTYLQRMILVTMSRHIEFDLREVFFARLSAQPPAFFHRYSTGDLMARATNDLNAVRMLCGPAIMYGTNTVFTGLGALAFMLHLDLPLTLLALAPMPLVAMATRLFGARIHHLFGRVQESFSDLSTRVQESLSGSRVVRAYAREEGEEAAFDRRNRAYVERNRHLIRWNAAFTPAIQALVGLGFVVVLWYGGLLVTRGALTVGELVTFIFFLGKLVWPMIAIGFVINLIERGKASLGRIAEVVEAEPEVADEEPLVDPGALAGAVACRDLSFAYAEGGEVLSGVDFSVPAGTTVAVVGRTGSGKSTLLSLIPRLANPPEQSLLLDGIDVRRLPLARLREAVAMVPQESFLFSTTVRDNIAFGRPDASEEEITEVVEMAGLTDDLVDFPKGLDTRVGERGITLSGGQKQRVALARALLRRPRILLLDDALSAVDTHTEETILANLRRLFEGRTVFLVSHRISTVQDADLILVLEEGRISERGTHQELLASGGLYADLHRRQQLEEELATA